MVKSDKTAETEELILKSQSGSAKALEDLIRHVQKDIYTMFCYLTTNKHDVSDLTQEALIKMAKNLYLLKEPKCFNNWLNRIVTNTFFDYTRRHSADKFIEHDENKINELKDKIGCEPGEKCFFAEIDKVIHAALLNLPENLRIAIILREYEGLSYHDISKLTNTNLGTVKSRIARARLRLQKDLREFI